MCFSTQRVSNAHSTARPPSYLQGLMAGPHHTAQLQCNAMQCNATWFSDLRGYYILGNNHQSSEINATKCPLAATVPLSYSMTPADSCTVVVTDRQSQSSPQATEDDWRPPAMVGCEFFVFLQPSNLSIQKVHAECITTHVRLYRCIDLHMQVARGIPMRILHVGRRSGVQVGLS